MILYEQVTGEGLLVVLGVPHHPRQCLSYNLITLNMSTDTGELRPSDPPPRYSLQAARADASKQVSSETTADQHRFARRRSQSSTLTQT